MAISIIKYNKIKLLPQEFEEVSIDTFVPQPEDNDYKRGYIKRYFIQKANDINSPIFEIEKTQYSKISLNPFYKTISLDWRLKGDRNEVIKSNSKSVLLAEKNMKLIGLHLPNKLQFYKG